MKSREYLSAAIGVVPRRGRERAAICVVEVNARGDKGGSRDHYVVRHLERLAPHSNYPAIAARTAEIVGNLADHADEALLYVDATDCGEPVVDLFREDPRTAEVIACYFNHGAHWVREAAGVRLGKVYLVSNLQTLLEAGRLHMRRTAETEILAQELEDYETRAEPNGDNLSGAFRVGSRDELVTALGLAAAGAPTACPGQLVY